MKILLVGSGGREHAIAWHLKKDPRVTELFIAPGNPGTAALGVNLPIAATDLPALLAWAEREKPDLTFVGPEAPLCLGLADLFEGKGFAVFGPNQYAARLEGSKVLTKRLFQDHGIATARGACFGDPLAAYAYSQGEPYPQVIKADGLAAGKGVIIAKNPEQATKAIYDIMERRVFGDAGAQIVIEECLTGPEVSLMAITDGQSLRLLPVAQDHKRIGDGDTGPNTGGMGAYAPARFLSDAAREEIVQTILLPLLAALRQEGIDYRGVLYAGLMLTPKGPQMLEINVRLGDPETQVLLPLLETSLVDIAQAVVARKLGDLTLAFNALTAVGIVLAAPGYPEAPRLGGAIEITGPAPQDAILFHAGTREQNGQVVTSGGRVITATAWAADFATARKLAYAAVETVRFPGLQFRHDIGAQAGAA